MGCSGGREGKGGGGWVVKRKVGRRRVSFGSGVEGMMGMIGEVVGMGDKLW